MENLYPVYVIFFLASIAIRDAYEVLKKIGKIGDDNALVTALIFLAMILLWTSWFAMCPLDPFVLSVPDIVRWIGLGLVLLGWGLALGALVGLRGVENIDHLVTTGLFARLRHPMYTGFIFWIAGWTLFHGALISLAVGMAGVASVCFWRWLEEKRLVARYGDTYLAYRARTWF